MRARIYTLYIYIPTYQQSFIIYNLIIIFKKIKLQKYAFHAYYFYSNAYTKLHMHSNKYAHTPNKKKYI
jgi:hypothetical protein